MKVFITRNIPVPGIEMLKQHNFEVVINPEDKVLSKKELVEFLKAGKYDAVLCLLTDRIDAEIFEAAGKQCKIFANYAVGFDNINLAEAKKRGIIITNTPGTLTEAVAEYAIAMIFAITKRVVEADKFIRAGKFEGWSPKLFLGGSIKGKTLGIIGLGRIGSDVAERMHDGFGLKIIYYDLLRNKELEKKQKVEYKSMDDLLQESDFVSIHVNLTDQTRHLINSEKLKLMKSTACIINTSRGPVIDEKALTDALKNNIIAGAALDVFENEPKLTPGLTELDNVILTPHIASATLDARDTMSKIAAQNIIEVLEDRAPINPVA